MRVREFARAGHWPTLVCAFLYFDMSFMVWMLLGALGVFIAQEFGLTPAEKGLLVAVPVLGGTVLRIVLGVASDRWGAKRVGIAGMLLTAVPLLWGGFAMCSFAASLGVGAGNSGTVLAALCAPRLAEIIGWRGVFRLALIPLCIVLLVFMIFAGESPERPTRPRYGAMLGERDLWWLNLFYCITFGGFVGLASFLPIFFFDQYGCSRVTAGTWAALCVAAGSFLRPVGGHLADRLGGASVLGVLYASVAMLAALLAQLPAQLLALLLLVVTMACLGMGNGAVFQLVGQRFAGEVGVATGIIGAAGGLGGFVLPSVFGVLKQLAGSYGVGFALYAVVTGSAALTLTLVRREWRQSWESFEIAS